MFIKNNFTVKSSTCLRHSERKALFPERLNACFNSKQQFSQLKIIFQNGASYGVFLHNNEPMFFTRPGDGKVLYPSVYFLWAFPDHFPVLHIQFSVFSYLQKGSDLMIPGIFLDFDFPEFEVNSPVAIAAFNENDQMICLGPLAVGRALFSSDEMRVKRLTGQKGKAMEILHIFGDTLWAFGSKKEFPTTSNTNINKQSEEIENAKPNVSDQDDEKIDEAYDGDGDNNEEKPEPEQRPELVESSSSDMDKLLQCTFFSALRWNLLDEGPEKFPIDAGQFYANFILKNLPPGKRLEIKKTSYKKFSNFLRKVNSNAEGWIVKLKTVKGIDSIESVNFEHPLVQQAAPLPEQLDQQNEGASTSQNMSNKPYLTIKEQQFSLTEQVLPLFRPAGYHKGDLVDLNRIRQVLMEYAQNQNLLKEAGKSIELDDQLQIIVKHFLHDCFPVNTIVQKLSSAMTKTVLIQTSHGQQFVHRGKVPNVEIKIEKRSGNKLVTLVSNLVSFGIDAKMVDKEIKGTGTSILPSAPGFDGPQLLVQGNEVNKIGRILDGLGLPKKFIKGLELGVKEKKSKK